MTIQMGNPEPVSEAEISAFEQAAGVTLPRDYREFIREFSGARPEPNIFDVGADNNSGINQFIAVKEILDARQYIYNVDCSFIPIARASCGNYVCIDLDADGEIFYWDHEEPSSGIRIARSFGDFLGRLKRFDAKQIAKIPRQVESVWIDPDFLRQQQDEGNAR